MKNAKAAGKRRAGALVRRVPLAPLASLPGRGGDAGARAVIVQARLLILGDGDHRAGLRLLDSVPPATRGTTGGALRAWALDALGRPGPATDEARTVLAGQPDAEALSLVMGVARRSGESALVEGAAVLAVRAQPRTSKAAMRLLREFRTSDPERAAAFIANTHTWDVHLDRDAAEVARHEIELRAAGDGDARRAKALHIGGRSPAGFRAATRALDRMGAWEELHQLYGATPSEGRALVPPKDSVALAQRAARAGRLDTAQLISDGVIRTHRSEDARAVHARVSDQIHIARTGWPVDEAQERVYVPTETVVSVLAQSLPHRSGGYATRSHGILSGLTDLGWSVHPVTRLGFPYDIWDPHDTRQVADSDTVDAVTYRRLLEPGERSYPTTPLAGYIDRFAGRVADMAIEHRAGLIHASSFQNNGLAGLRAARRLGVPFVYEMRGLEDLMKVSRDADFRRTDAHRYMTGLELHIVQHADLTFVITEALREEMIRRGGPAERIEVLPNGVHTQQFEPREPDEGLLDTLGLRDKTVIGYAGGLVDYEGLDLLLLATARLTSTRDDFAVVIVGDGPSQQRLQRMARELDILDVVTFTGRVPHTEISRYLSVFDITPFPRLPRPVCELISPIKPLEAMAMGTASIVSSVAALTEIVEPESRGLVFDAGDDADLARQLGRYLDDPGLRATMGRRARTWVLSERDWQHITPIVDRAYRRLMG